MALLSLIRRALRLTRNLHDQVVNGRPQAEKAVNASPKMGDYNSVGQNRSIGIGYQTGSGQSQGYAPVLSAPSCGQIKENKGRIGASNGGYAASASGNFLRGRRGDFMGFIAHDGRTYVSWFDEETGSYLPFQESSPAGEAST